MLRRIARREGDQGDASMRCRWEVDLPQGGTASEEHRRSYCVCVTLGRRSYQDDLARGGLGGAPRGRAGSGRAPWGTCRGEQYHQRNTLFLSTSERYCVEGQAMEVMGWGMAVWEWRGTVWRS
jgi:hypothetical protein